MTYKNHGTPFRNLIGNTYNPNERKIGINVTELRQISNPYQKVNLGNENRYKVDELGIVTGRKDRAVVYAC